MRLSNDLLGSLEHHMNDRHDIALIALEDDVGRNDDHGKKI